MATTLDMSRARLLYTRTVTPLDSVAAVIGWPRSSLRLRLPALGWPRRSRRAVLRRDVRRDAAATPVDRFATGLSIERFIAGRIAAYEADARSGREADPERTARTVSHYARALELVRAYLALIEKDRAAAESGPPPRSLSELRDELRRHLDRLHDERGAVGGVPEA